jgi:hypothetical protein
VLKLARILAFVGMTLGFRQAALGMHPELFGQPARISIKKAERGHPPFMSVHAKNRDRRKCRGQKIDWSVAEFCPFARRNAGLARERPKRFARRINNFR